MARLPFLLISISISTLTSVRLTHGAVPVADRNVNPDAFRKCAALFGNGSTDPWYLIKPRWPRECVMAFFDVLRSCSRHHDSNRIDDCVNLARAGSGTAALHNALAPLIPVCDPDSFRPKSARDRADKVRDLDAEIATLEARIHEIVAIEARPHENATIAARVDALRSQDAARLESRLDASREQKAALERAVEPRPGHHGCYHDARSEKHVAFSAMTARRMGAKCVIMTFRDMRSRVESGFKYGPNQHALDFARAVRDARLGKGPVEAPGTTINELFGPKLSRGKPPSKTFGRSHLTYLLGLSAEMCSEEKFEVHLLCTENLDAELLRLDAIFPGVRANTTHAHNNSRGSSPTSRSFSTYSQWMEAAELNATLAESVDQLYTEDQIIHDLICASHRGRGEYA